jgi:hypothetical protein
MSFKVHKCEANVLPEEVELPPGAHQKLVKGIQGLKKLVEAHTS